MPRYPIARSTNFIIENESWAVIEYDHTSVPGTIYLSLTENKINRYYDDTVANIADTDKRAVYKAVFPDIPHPFSVGEPIVPIHYTLMKNGVECDTVEVEFDSTDKTIARKVNGVLTAIKEGDVDLHLTLVGINEPIDPEYISIHIGEDFTPSAYIDGPDYIRVSEDGQFRCVATDRVDSKGDESETEVVPMEVSFKLGAQSEPNLVTLKKDTDNPLQNSCTIYTNKKGKIGTFELIMTYENVDYTKTISVVPLWR